MNVNRQWMSTFVFLSVSLGRRERFIESKIKKNMVEQEKMEERKAGSEEWKKQKDWERLYILCFFVDWRNLIASTTFCFLFFAPPVIIRQNNSKHDDDYCIMAANLLFHSALLSSRIILSLPHKLREISFMIFWGLQVEILFASTATSFRAFRRGAVICKPVWTCNFSAMSSILWNK